MNLRIDEQSSAILGDAKRKNLGLSNFGVNNAIAKYFKKIKGYEALTQSDFEDPEIFER